ncbi:blastula protease 10-like [Saccostrea cucullata]|uniref:blastula protease 10-like n=1 Tax=Saccostrea cuccullata TaxID=36930 RepID=UPI002ECFB1B0
MLLIYILLCVLVVQAEFENEKELIKLLKTHDRGQSSQSKSQWQFKQVKEKDDKIGKKKIVWRGWEKLQKPGKWHKNMIKEWYDHPHSQDDAIADLLQTMVVFDKNGKPHMPNGIHPSKKKSAIAEKFDGHIYPQDKKNKSTSEDKRNFAERYVKLWDYGYIPYYIDSKFTTRQRQIVNQAIREFSQKTCIRLVPGASADWSSLPHKDYIYFTYGKACSSAVGRTGNGEQRIGLNASYCFTQRTVIHEIMHALGQLHEQQRKDRDDHVIMHWDQIEEGRQNQNMERLSLGSHDRTPYDVTSILQYGLTAFTKTGLRTMTLKDKKLEGLVKSSEGLTHLDVKEITLAYQCSSKCVNKPSCLNGGFVGKNCDCECPDGLTGTICQGVESDAGCGGILNLNSNGYRDLKSINYPNAYPVDKECTILITAPKGSKIKLEVMNNELNLRRSASNYCYHWIEVRYTSTEINGPKFCNPFSPIVSEGNQMMIRFNSRFSKDYLPYSGQKFFLRASTGGGSPSTFNRACNFDSSNTCWMIQTRLQESLNKWWLDPPSGARNTPGYAYIDTVTTFSLATPRNTFTDGDYCLKFSYYMKGSSVFIGLYDTKWIWHSNTPSEGYWMAVTGNYRASASSVLQIYGALNSTGMIAVDEVEIKSGRC